VSTFNGQSTEDLERGTTPRPLRDDDASIKSVTVKDEDPPEPRRRAFIEEDYYWAGTSYIPILLTQTDSRKDVIDPLRLARVRELAADLAVGQRLQRSFPEPPVAILMTIAEMQVAFQ
jgi:hypothetical protein